MEYTENEYIYALSVIGKMEDRVQELKQDIFSYRSHGKEILAARLERVLPSLIIERDCYRGVIDEYEKQH